MPYEKFKFFSWFEPIFIREEYLSLSYEERRNYWWTLIVHDLMFNYTTQPLHLFTKENYQKWKSVEKDIDVILDDLMEEIEEHGPWEKGMSRAEVEEEINKRLGRLHKTVHHDNVPKYSGTLQELAVDIANMRYDALSDFLNLLSNKLHKDADADKGRGREKLAKLLYESSASIGIASESIEKAWGICKPYMDIVEPLKETIRLEEEQEPPSHFNDENLPQYFWRYIKDAYQTNWWFDLNLEVLHVEIDDFIRRYVHLCMKYGINIPSDLPNDQSFKSIEEYIHRISHLVKIKAKKHIIHLFTGYYKRDEQQTLLNNTIMFVQGQDGAFVQIAYPNGKDDCLTLSIGTFDRNATTFFIRLGTNAFFSDLYEYGDEEDDTDNSALAYLNTPRLNSYIRDFTRLMVEYGCTNYGVDGFESEEFFNAPYLLVDGEVLFYEDIYELLPEEHRYKRFEEIDLGFDK